MKRGRMVDIHAHILPGLDDGAKNPDEALSLLRIAERQGICGVIATPHASPQFPEHPADTIRKLAQELQRQARESGSRCTIYPGEEIMYREEIFQRLHSGELLTLAESDYILVEFHRRTPYSEIRRAVREAVCRGYRPILAHIERYDSLRADGRLEELAGDGAYHQMNFQSLLGRWYDRDAAWCRETIRRKRIHFLATDMHNLTARRPSPAEALLWLEKRGEPRYVRKLLAENAVKILKNEQI